MATLLPEGKQSFTDDAGNPLVGGKLYTYDAGTSSPRPTYSDTAGSIPNTNPVVLDARGEAIIFWKGVYKVVLKDSLENTIWSIDGVATTDPSNTTSDMIGYDGGTVQTVLDDAKPMANYTALRAYTGRATGVRITQTGIAGFFQRDDADASSADNGGTIIVDASGRRWKRLFVGEVNVKWFGAVGDGVTAAAAAIQAAINSGMGSIYIPDGQYLIDADLIVPDNVCIYFGGDAVFKASANNRTFFKSNPHAYFSQIHNAQLDGNGKTGVIGFDMTNFRLNAGIFNPFMMLMEYGFIGRQGCFGTPIDNPTAYGVKYPILFIENNSGTVVTNPNFDNSVVAGGDGTGSGVTVQYGSGSNLGSVVKGGYIQGFALGVDDAGIGTVLDSIYFEACTSVDVAANTTARNGRYVNLSHWGATGPCGYRLRNTDSMVIENPVMGSGGRTGMFDIDTTNTNCTGRLSNSAASLNSPIGTITGILLSNYTQGITITDGSGAGLTLTQNAQAVMSIAGKVVTVTADITYPVTADASFAMLNLPYAGTAGIPINAAVGYTNYGAALTLNGAGSTVGILLTSSGGNLTNANLSGRRLAFTFSYIAK